MTLPLWDMLMRGYVTLRYELQKMFPLSDFRQPLKKMDRRCAPAISGDLLSAVISTCYILGFRKDNFNVFNNLAKN
jgi:hypothetical protein